MTKIRPTATDAILEAAFQTFNENPSASLGDIAKRAGVGRATLHRHFSGRDALMLALAQTATKELDAAVDAATKNATSHTEALRLSLHAIIPLGNRQWFLSHEAVDKDPDLKASYQDGMTELEHSIDAAKAEGTFDPNVPTRWIAQSYEDLIYTAWTLVRKQEATATQAADLAWRTLTTGLKGAAI